jgi:hypothetical protein
LFHVTGNNAIVAIMISGICSLQEEYFVVLHKYKIRGGDIGISRAHENGTTKKVGRRTNVYIVFIQYCKTH